MSESGRYVWIKTQDGSPTLWNNDLGEPFRSVKGAFHESTIVFVNPAIEFARSLDRPIVLGEFGLGVGTNWVFFALLAAHYKIPYTYYAIERDTEPFELALRKWDEKRELIAETLRKHAGVDLAVNVAALPKPIVSPSLPQFVADFEASGRKADVWFHDPFGFGVNPEGYSEENLLLCKRLWASPFIGLSYACNTGFQRKLKDMGIAIEKQELNSPPLKKERLKFSF